MSDQNMTADDLFTRCHNDSVSAGWWSTDDLEDIAAANLQCGMIVATKLALIHSEVSEALEGHRKGLKDDHLPDRDMVAVELADAVIRIADLAGALNIDLAQVMVEKLDYNRSRADHKPKARAAAGGKRY